MSVKRERETPATVKHESVKQERDCRVKREIPKWGPGNWPPITKLAETPVPFLPEKTFSPEHLVVSVAEAIEALLRGWNWDVECDAWYITSVMFEVAFMIKGDKNAARELIEAILKHGYGILPKMSKREVQCLSLTRHIHSDFAVVSWNQQREDTIMSQSDPREYCFSMLCPGHNHSAESGVLCSDEVPSINIQEASGHANYHEVEFMAYLPLPLGIMTQDLKGLHDYDTEFEDVKDGFRTSHPLHRMELEPKFRTFGPKQRFKNYQQYVDAVQARFYMAGKYRMSQAAAQWHLELIEQECQMHALRNMFAENLWLVSELIQTGKARLVNDRQQQEVTLMRLRSYML